MIQIWNNEPSSCHCIYLRGDVSSLSSSPHLGHNGSVWIIIPAPENFNVTLNSEL